MKSWAEMTQEKESDNNELKIDGRTDSVESNNIFRLKKTVNFQPLKKKNDAMYSKDPNQQINKKLNKIIESIVVLQRDIKSIKQELKKRPESLSTIDKKKIIDLEELYEVKLPIGSFEELFAFEKLLREDRSCQKDIVSIKNLNKCLLINKINYIDHYYCDF